MIPSSLSDTSPAGAAGTSTSSGPPSSSTLLRHPTSQDTHQAAFLEAQQQDSAAQVVEGGDAGDAPPSDLHWASEMALRLLQERHRCDCLTRPPPPSQPALRAPGSSSTFNAGGMAGTGSSSSGRGRDTEASDGDRHARSSQGAGASSADVGWCPWLDLLPQSVMTPLEFSAEELLTLGDAAAMGEVQSMRACMQDCFQVSAQVHRGVTSVERQAASVGCCRSQEV